MNIWNSILFGIIQGLTELLPVSSSAHLAVLGNLFGLSGSGLNYQMFCCFLHFGTILAVLISFWQDIFSMVLEIGTLARPSHSRNLPNARLFIMICLSTAPLFFLIPLSAKVDRLYYSSIFIGASTILTGIMLFVIDRIQGNEKSQTSMTMGDAILIGFCQLVACIPGISRTATVYSSCLVTGLNRETALKYTYLLSLPAAFGVNVLHLVQSADAGMNWKEVPLYLLGMAAAILSGLLAIRVMKNVVKRGKVSGFAYYCCVAGVLFIILTMIF